MSRASITKAHNKIQELSWDPTFVEPVDKYPTDYTFEKAPKKDPLKQVLRSYFPMQEEKDHRVYGASDGATDGLGGSVGCGVCGTGVPVAVPHATRRLVMAARRRVRCRAVIDVALVCSGWIDRSMDAKIPS